MANWWMIVPGSPVASVIVLIVAVPFLLGALWAARRSVHGIIIAFTHALTTPLRSGGRWLMRAASELRARNRAVLLAHGREEVKQAIDREFERITKMVERDLNDYPALQRKVMDEVTRIEEDYKKCTEVPPPPPEWTEAVANIAKIKSRGDGIVEKLLEDISKSIDKGYNKVLSEYRKSYESRHKILKGFMPHWRAVDQSMKEVDKKMASVLDNTASIDAHMDKFEQIIGKTDSAEHSLTASATIQFFIASLVLTIAVGGAFVNYKLIALPMSEMVGGGDYITKSLQASDIAALVIIFVEATMGLFLMETLRITHLFPRINNMPDKKRHMMMWIAFTILFILAGIEVALAVMRDQIVTASLELKQSLAGADGAAAKAAAAATSGLVAKIPALGQMILGFILPFALAFVGIPLEYFIYAARTVFGALLVLGIQGVAISLRILGNILRNVGGMMVHLYDAIIFLPLLIESGIRKKMGMPSVIEAPSFKSTVTSFSKRRVATGER